LGLTDAGIAQTGLRHTVPYLRSGVAEAASPHFHDPGASGAVLYDLYRQYLTPRMQVVIDALLADFKTLPNAGPMPPPSRR